MRLYVQFVGQSQLRLPVNRGKVHKFAKRITLVWRNVLLGHSEDNRCCSAMDVAVFNGVPQRRVFGDPGQNAQLALRRV